MPTSAVQNVEVDHVLPADRIAPMVMTLVQETLEPGATAMNVKTGKNDTAEHANGAQRSRSAPS